MKNKIIFTLLLSAVIFTGSYAQSSNLYIDVHHLKPGSVKLADVEAAHQKDVAVGRKFGVHFINYWFDEAAGNIYCLSKAADPGLITKTHAEAHGLLPAKTYLVKSGKSAMIKPGMHFYLDVHEMGAGKVTLKAVAAAHKKDLAAQGKYGVNFLNYWVDEKSGTIMCLSQAPDSTAVINTHKEAHGLLPVSIEEVKQGS